MTLTTRPVRLQLLARTGAVLPGARVRAQLTDYQVDGQDVVPLVWALEEESNAPGYYSGALWPNSRTNGGTQYLITADSGDLRMQAQLHTVPQGASTVSIKMMVNATPWPAVYEASAEVEKALVFSNSAGQSASLALVAGAASAELAEQLGDVAGAVAQTGEAASTAVASAAVATAARTAAELARDASFVTGPKYPTEALGRAAVADGVNFLVQGAGDVAAYEYRRVNSSSSVLIAKYPSADSVAYVNKFTDGSEVGRLIPENMVPGWYVGAIPGSPNYGKLLQTAGAIMYFFPVSPGNSYRISAASAWPAPEQNLQTVALRATAHDGTSATLGVATLESDTATSRIISIPLGSPARFAFLNVKVSTLDISASLRVERSEKVSAYDGRLVADLEARESIAELDSKIGNFAYENKFTDGSEVGDLIPENIIPGWYVNASPVTPTYGWLVHPGTASILMYYFPVVPGNSYRISAASAWPAPEQNLQTVALRALPPDGTLTTLGVATLEPDTTTSRIITIPLGSAARYAFLNMKVATLDISTSLRVERAEKIGAYDGCLFVDLEARALIAAIPAQAATAGARRLKGKRWAVVGDSITQKTNRANKNYHDFISEAAGGIVIDNKGIGGTGYYDRNDVASTITTTPDVITVFLGTNDWAGSGAAATMPLGLFGDTTTATLAGCIHKLLSGLIAAFPAVPIGVATPLPRGNCWGDPGTANGRGYTLRQLSDLVIRHAKHFSLPYIDLYAESSLPVFDSAGNVYFFTAPDGTAADGLHPNDAGQAVIGRKFMTLLDRM